MAEAPGPLVNDGEDAYKAILYPWQWASAKERPSSAAFDEEKFSVDIASRTTPKQVAARFNIVHNLVKFNCGEARQEGFETRDELDPEHPDNLAHAHVYFLEYSDTSRNKRKAKARNLAKMCVVVPHD